MATEQAKKISEPDNPEVQGTKPAVNAATEKKLVSLPANTELQDLNAKLAGLENSLRTLGNRLDRSHKDIVKAVGDLEGKSQINTSDIKENQGQLKQLDKAYNQIEKQVDKLLGEAERLSSLLEKTDLKQTAAVEGVEKKFDAEIAAVAKNIDNLAKSHEKLTDKSEQLTNETVVLAEKIKHLEEKVDAEFAKTKTHLLAHDEKIEQLETKDAELESNISEQASKLKALKESVEARFSTNENRLDDHDKTIVELREADAELSERAVELKATTERLNEQSEALEQTTQKLLEHSDQLQKSVRHLEFRADSMDEKAEEMAEKIDLNAHIEKTHFNFMRAGLAAVVVATIAGFVWTYSHQESISEVTGQKLEHQQAMIDLGGEKSNLLQQQIEGLKTQLQVEQSKTSVLEHENMIKTVKINKLDKQVTEIDGNLQYVNESVGPLADYNRYVDHGKLKDSQWLLEQSPENFGIQLISVTDRKDMYKYVEEFGYYLQQGLSYYTIESEGMEHFVLVYGSFGNYNDAAAAQGKLPFTATRQKLGIAKMEDIQKVMVK